MRRGAWAGSEHSVSRDRLRSRQVAENQNPERAGGRRAGCRQIDNVCSAWVRDNR